MTANSYGESARIYQFPVKVRAAAGANRTEEPAAIVALQRVPQIEFGSGWYHEAAIQEAEPARKR